MPPPIFCPASYSKPARQQGRLPMGKPLAQSLPIVLSVETGGQPKPVRAAPIRPLGRRNCKFHIVFCLAGIRGGSTEGGDKPFP